MDDRVSLGVSFLYLTADGKQEGPVSLEALNALRTSGSITDTTLVWTQSFKEWAAYSQIGSLLNAPNSSTSGGFEVPAGMLYYSDKQGQPQGPLEIEKLLPLWDNGVIDGMTLVWGHGVTQWIPLSDYEPAKLVLQRLGEEDEEEDFDEINLQRFAQKRAGLTHEAALAMGSEAVAAAMSSAAAAAAAKGGKTTDADDGSEAQEENGEDGCGKRKRDEAAMALKKEKRKRYQENKKKRWRNIDNSKKVYVNGLPLDTTEEEVAAYFTKKCGIIDIDVTTGLPKVKLYRDTKTNVLKGDGLISFVKEPSVDIAMQLCEGDDFRDGFILHVERPVFEMKGEKFVPKEKKQLKPEEKIQMIKLQQQFSWNEGVDDGSGLRIVVLKHVFSVEEAQSDPDYYRGIKKDVMAECRKLGTVDKVTVFERNPEGVVAVKFAEGHSALKCIETMNGRFFAGRVIEADYYDGRTNYKVKETDAELQHRIDDFGKWLGDDGSGFTGGVQSKDASEEKPADPPAAPAAE